MPNDSGFAQRRRSYRQWRNKVVVGPRASIPKGPPLPQKKLFKNSVGQILGPPQRWARVHCTPCTPYSYATAPKKSVYLTNFYVVTGCRTLAFVISLLAVLFTCGTVACFDFEIGMTS